MDKKYKELDKTSYEFVQVSKKLGDDATELLKMVLDKCHNNEIELDFEHSVSVCYDGGNHPEYASNCFSNVECVYLQDGEIYYDCEDCSRLTFKYLTADEMYNIADNVYLQYKADYEETND